AGLVTTIAGSLRIPGSADGAGSAARFNHPSGVAVDRSGRLYVADTYNDTIRSVAPDGTVTTLAGLTGVFGPNDGTNGGARFHEPQDIAVDGAGNLYVADTLNYTIREIIPSGTNWIVRTIAGTPGTPGTND